MMKWSPKRGFAEWLLRLRAVLESNQIAGLEKWFDVIIVTMRIFTLAYWIRYFLEDTAFYANPTVETRWTRDRVIEGYVVFQLVVLFFLWWMPRHVGIVHVVLAIYILAEMYINLFSIIFVGKLDVNAPTASIERSLLLFLINAAQIVLSFSVFYRAAFGFDAGPAIVNAALVFGTLGHPIDTKLDSLGSYEGGYVVAAQIGVDFVFVAIFLSAFVGRVAAFDRMRRQP